MKCNLAPLLLFVALAPPALAGDPAPVSLAQVPALLKQVIQNQRRLDGRTNNADYVSTVRVKERWFDRKGGLKSSSIQVYDHYPASPQSINILTETDGVPTAPAKLEKERAKALKAMEQYLTISTGKPIEESENRPGFRFYLGVYDFLRYSDFHAVEHGSLGGRPMLLLRFRPKAGWVDPQGLVHQLSGVLWIDAAEKVVARARVWPTSLEPAETPFFEMDHQKVFSDLWALVHFRLNPAVKPELFKNQRFDWAFNSHDFQRFSVEQGQITRIAP
jgi:hypothetical protein